MDGDRETTRQVREALEQVRTMLAARLAPLAAGRALLQLAEREVAGEPLETVTHPALLARLLDELGPQARDAVAYVGIVRSLVALDPRSDPRRMLALLPAAPSPAVPVPAVAVSAVPVPAVPVSADIAQPEPARRRVKIKAATSEMPAAVAPAGPAPLAAVPAMLPVATPELAADTGPPAAAAMTATTAPTMGVVDAAPPVVAELVAPPAIAASIAPSAPAPPAPAASALAGSAPAAATPPLMAEGASATAAARDPAAPFPAAPPFEAAPAPTAAEPVADATPRWYLRAGARAAPAPGATAVPGGGSSAAPAGGISPQRALPAGGDAGTFPAGETTTSPEAAHLSRGVPPAAPPVSASPVSASPAAAPPTPAAPSRAASALAEPPVATSPGIGESLPASRADLGRIRLLEAIERAEPEELRPRERYDGAVSWARPEATWQPPRIEPPPAFARLETAAPPIDRGAVPSPSPDRRPVARPAMAQPPVDVRAPAPSTPPVAVARSRGDDRIVAALRPEVPLHAPDRQGQPRAEMAAPARVAEIETEIASLVGDRAALHAGRRGAGASLGDGEAPGGNATEPMAHWEADVEIVAVRGSPVPVDARVEARRPAMPLTLRLKQQEREIEFDGDSYAAYHDDVGEASVEIIQQDPEPGSANHDAAGSGRREPVAARVGRKG